MLSKTVDKIAVVDDGALIPEIQCDLMVRLDRNYGKAEAVRRGLKEILKTGDVDYIIQSDADLDQNPNDAHLFVEYLRNNNISGDIPTLVIGDRYPKNLDSQLEYRRKILGVFEMAGRIFKVRIRDIVSGFRAYTRVLAESFVDIKSERYGIEMAQLVVAYLNNAKIDYVILSWSRPRDPDTDKLKILQNIESISLYMPELKKRGGTAGVFVRIFSIWKAFEKRRMGKRSGVGSARTAKIMFGVLKFLNFFVRS